MRCYVRIQGVCLLMMIHLSMGYGQVTHERMTIDWEHFGKVESSPKGNWLVYQVGSDTKKDTVFVKELPEGKCYTYPKGSQVMFDASDTYAVVLIPEHPSVWVHLKTGKVDSLPAASKAVFWEAYHRVWLYDKNSEQLIAYDYRRNHREVRDSVYQFWHRKDKLLIADTQGLWLLKSEKEQSWKLLRADDSGRYSGLEWNGKGDAFVVQRQAADTLLYHGTLAEQESFETFPRERLGDSLRWEPQARGSVNLHFSEDDQWVWVPVNRASEPLSEELVEVWNWNSQKLYPFEKKEERWPFYMLWNPQTDSLKSLEDIKDYNLIGLSNRSEMLFYKIHGIVSQYSTEVQAPLEVRSYPYEQSSQLLDTLHIDYQRMLVQPQGRYMVYFKDGNWWLYDFKQQQVSWSTATHHTSWGELDRSLLFESPYEDPVWSHDGKKVLLTARYDLWEFDIVTGEGRRITQGSERQHTYRMIKKNLPERESTNWYTGLPYETKDGILLEESWDDSIRYVQYTSGRLVSLWEAKDVNMRFFLQLSGQHNYYFIRESLNEPPSLWFLKPGKKPVLIHQLNKEYPTNRYSALLVSYTNPQGDALEGILYLPPEFDRQKKYPMVVHVYEEQSYQWGDFLYAKDQNINGFNPANLLELGYVVFYPSIAYHLGAPGASALESVEAGVQKVVSYGFVAEDKIGIYGHSFGAYEAAYILTHSNLFATGIVGSGSYDMISRYLSVDWIHGHRPHLWRYESHQYRMGSSLFENTKGYMENSPILAMENLEVPVFIWAGKKDVTIDWEQSLELHIALRRLQKPHELWVFPTQGHVLFDEAMQVKLTRQVEEWFDMYLK